MTSALRLTVHQARLVHLAAQGLLARPRRRARTADVLTTIGRMRVLQIDTIHVVARSPYLVLFSRLGTYRQRWLDEWLEAGAIFECWAHEACFAPTADFALHRRHALERLNHWAMKHALRMRREQAPAMDALLAHIRETGPVKAADFESREGAATGGWWGWKNEKRWLEALFALGELMIARRENFQRVYDLSERVLAKTDTNAAASVSAAEMQREFVLGAVRSLGATQARWIADYFRSGRRLKDADLDPYVENGEVLRIPVEGWSVPAYVHADHRDIAIAAAHGRLRATHTTLLSPFDPVVWDRERATMLFDFDYRLECYTPAPKRRYGYYVLPILHRGRLVGRLDAKAHRAEERFEVKALFLENGVEVTDAFVESIATAIERCAQWHATPDVHIGPCTPRTFRSPLRQALRKLETGTRRR